jgi:tripartite-type tricarboxylate transporter receptor subunit TctC
VTSLKASPLVPNLPALAQSGLADFEVIGWNGFVAPKATSPPILARLNGAIRAGLDDADLRGKLAAAGYEAATLKSPTDFAHFIAADTRKWIDLVAKTNMKAN